MKIFRHWIFILLIFSAQNVFADSTDYRKLFENYKRPASGLFPQDNAFSASRAELGKMLFFDPRLSGSHFISCATCHTRIMPDGAVIKGAQGNFPFARAFAEVRTELQVAFDLLGRKGLVQADAVRAELAAAIPGFAALAGTVQANGVLLA